MHIYHMVCRCPRSVDAAQRGNTRAAFKAAWCWISDPTFDSSPSRDTVPSASDRSPKDLAPAERHLDLLQILLEEGRMSKS